jgi:hypothetical protein
MRIRLVLATMFLVVQGWAMTPQYSAYLNHAVDASHIYATGVVDGSTLCDPNCPPGAMHTGKVYLQLGSSGGSWVYGNRVTPPTYLSVSNSRTINATPGVVYPESDTKNVNCSIVGNFFNSGGTTGLSLRTSYWGPPVTIVGNTCYYGSLACSPGTTATCPNGTGVTFVPACPPYVKAEWLYDTGKGQCIPPAVVSSAKGPGACD